MEETIKILGSITLIVIVAVLFAFPIKWLWNWLMPVIFGLPTITVWQALGMALLCNILFGKNYGTDKK